jgi:hypothetical protein
MGTQLQRIWPTPCGFERPRRWLAIFFPSNPAFRVSGRSMLGCIRVARVAALAFCRLRRDDLLDMKSEKCSFPVGAGANRTTNVRKRPIASRQVRWLRSWPFADYLLTRITVEWFLA